MEISFCERCRESIPDSEFDTGRAVRVGGSNFHAACAFRKALPGPGRGIPTALALLAAALGAYAAVRTFALEREVAGERVRREDDLRARDLARLDEGPQAGERVRAAVASAVAPLRAEQQKAVDGLAGTFRADLAAAREVARADVERQLAASAEAHQDRFVGIENRLGDMADWIRDVRDLAKRSADGAPAAPPVSPVVPPSDAPAASSTGPAPAAGPESPTRPAGPTPPTDPGDAKRRAAEVDKHLALLKDASDTVVFSAAMRLGELGDLRAVPALVETLRTHKYYYARLAAASSLGTLVAADAMPALLDALDDRDSLVQTAVAEAIAAITGEPFKNPLGRSKKELKALKDEWVAWWKAHEGEVRKRLAQPPA